MIRALEGEGWMHVLYRKLGRRPRPDLETATDVEQVLDAWRATVTKHGNPPVDVRDPTRRGLDETLSEVRAEGTKPYV
jgi:hypothetical protein